MKRQMMVLGLMVIMGLTVLASETDVTIVSAFPGNCDPGWKPTIDVSGAVGPKHVIDFDTGRFVVHDKATWKELQRFSQREFWNKVEQADSMDPKSYANDMRMLYDPLTERWMAFTAHWGSKTYLAVSTSSDPPKPWTGTLLPLRRTLQKFFYSTSSMPGSAASCTCTRSPGRDRR